MTYRRLPKPFTPEDLDRLERACIDMTLWMTCVFLHETGLRLAEACSVPLEQGKRWAAGDRVSWIGGKPETFRVVGKGDKERAVVLTRRALGAVKFFVGIDRYGMHRKVELLPWGPRMIEREVAALGKAADVAAHPHRFRHTFVQELVDSGAPIQVVADMAGHASITTTRLYFESSPVAKADALEGRRKYLRRR